MPPISFAFGPKKPPLTMTGSCSSDANELPLIFALSCNVSGVLLFSSLLLTSIAPFTVLLSKLTLSFPLVE